MIHVVTGYSVGEEHRVVLNGDNMLRLELGKPLRLSYNPKDTYAGGRLVLGKRPPIVLPVIGPVSRGDDLFGYLN